MLEALEEGLRAEVGIIAEDHATGTVNGTGVDTRDYDEALVIVNVGTISATGTATLTLQESDVLGSGYTAITGAAFTVFVAANDEQVYLGRVRVKNFKRFLRVVAVIATDVAALGAVILLGKNDGLKKVSQVNSTEFAIDYVSDGGVAA